MVAITYTLKPLTDNLIIAKRCCTMGICPHHPLANPSMLASSATRFVRSVLGAYFFSRLYFFVKNSLAWSRLVPARPVDSAMER